MVASVVYNSVRDVRDIHNMDLPKVEDFFYDQQKSCNPKYNKTKYCSDSVSTWIWECVGFNVIPFYADWHLMKGPFKSAFALGGDGIVFIDYNGSDISKGVTKVFRAYKAFSPPANSDYTYSLPYENQFVMEEMTMGTTTAIRPVSYGTKGWQLPFDADNRGIFCMFNKLWIHNFMYYNFNADDESKLKQFAIFTIQFLFQPVKIKRLDYFQFLIERLRCNKDACIEMDVSWLPCTLPQSIYTSELTLVKDDEIVKHFPVFTRDGRSSKEVKITGKQWKEQDYGVAGNNYIEVKVVGSGSDCCNDLKTCQEQLKKCQDELKKADQTVSELSSQLNDARKQLNASREELRKCNIKLLKTNNVIAAANARSLNDYIEKWLQTYIPQMITIIQQRTKDFDRSFIPILEAYLAQTDLSTKTSRAKLNDVLKEWQNIPPERQGPIAPYIMFLILLDLFSNYQRFPYNNRWNIWEGQENSNLIAACNTLVKYGIMGEDDQFTKYFYPINLPAFLQVPNTKNPTPTTDDHEEDDPMHPSQRPESTIRPPGEPHLLGPKDTNVPRDLPIFGHECEHEPVSTPSDDPTPKPTAQPEPDQPMSPDVHCPSDPAGPGGETEGPDVPMQDSAYGTDDTPGGDQR